MRNSFVHALTELAADDPKLFLITGDLGFGVLTDFAARFPNQFLNAGVAEQNMAGMALGLALEGRTVYIYSIANFSTLRCLEQLRNGAAYHQANVKVVSIGAGFAYGPAGFSHHATEDLAIMRALPNFKVVCPGSPENVTAATKAIHREPGPVYLRLGKGGEPALPAPIGNSEFVLGQALQLTEGGDVAILSAGAILSESLKTVEGLKNSGLQCSLYNMHTVKPIDAGLIERLSQRVKLIVTIEEHNHLGGLGSAVAEVLSQLPAGKAKLKIFGIPDSFATIVGDQNYLRKSFGLCAEAIIPQILEFHRKLN